VESDAGVAVDVVVVIEERGAERAGIGDGSEPSRKRRTVLEGLELGFAVGVVVGRTRWTSAPCSGHHIVFFAAPDEPVGTIDEAMQRATDAMGG
jgi:hypothetical protein